jgi:hypothetical protein
MIIIPKNNLLINLSFIIFPASKRAFKRASQNFVLISSQMERPLPNAQLLVILLKTTQGKKR